MWTDRRPAACQAAICSTAAAFDLFEGLVGPCRVLGLGSLKVHGFGVLGFGSLGFMVLGFWGFESRLNAAAGS